MTSQLSVWLPYVLILQILAKTEGGANFKLEMIGYSVANGKDWEGECCDVFLWGCVGQCDPILTFCLDSLSGNNSPQSCSYASHETGEYDDENSIRFNHDMNGVVNPIRKSFTAWPGGLKFKVLVEDHDSATSHDRIDTFVYTVKATPAKSSSEAIWIEKLIYGTRRSSAPTSLKFQYQVYCNNRYYGTSCNIYCYPRDNYSGHYTCDPDTGEKICLTGWEGKDCAFKVDYCFNHQCKNGGTCTVRAVDYFCICPDGFSGWYCDNVVTTTTLWRFSDMTRPRTKSTTVSTPVPGSTPSTVSTPANVNTTVVETTTASERSSESTSFHRSSIPDWAIGVIVGLSLLLIISCALICWRRMRKYQQRNDRPGVVLVIPGNRMFNTPGQNQPCENNMSKVVGEPAVTLQHSKAQPSARYVSGGNGVTCSNPMSGASVMPPSVNTNYTGNVSMNGAIEPPPRYSAVVGGYSRP